MSKKIKLNLGCYDRKIYGFVNVDVREDVEPDVVDDAFKLHKFEDNSVDLIYACHMLEHGDYKESEQALIRWREVLKPGGTLRLAVPDMEAHFEHYYHHRDLRQEATQQRQQPSSQHKHLLNKPELLLTSYWLLSKYQGHQK